MLPLEELPDEKETLMTPDLLWVAGGGAAGALCRHLISTKCSLRLGTAFPYGTLLVNVLGSLLMGLLGGCWERWGLFPVPGLLIGSGFLGALTTFSTFSMDTFAAFRDGQPGKAALNVALNTILCLGTAAGGFFLIVV